MMVGNGTSNTMWGIPVYPRYGVISVYTGYQRSDITLKGVTAETANDPNTPNGWCNGSLWGHGEYPFTEGMYHQ
jgi:hypothetical protein